MNSASNLRYPSSSNTNPSAKGGGLIHAFKKKSKRGIATPKSGIDLIKHRLKDAAKDHAERFKQEQKP